MVETFLVSFLCLIYFQRLRSLLQKRHISTLKAKDLTSGLHLDNGRPLDSFIETCVNKESLSDDNGE